MASTRLPELDRYYPVGTVYLTVDNGFDPNVRFGGTWVEIVGDEDTGLYLRTVSSNPNASGNVKVGVKTKTLGLANMPRHRHTGDVNSAGSHTHSMKYSTQLPASGSYWTPKTQGSDVVDGSTTNFTAAAGSHTHSFTTDYAGSSSPEPFNMNPWGVTMHVWHRTE